MNFKKILFVASVFGFISFTAPEAVADLAAMKARVPALVKAKTEGIVGEKLDGLVGLVSDDKSNPIVETLIESENADRLEVYRKRAAEQDQELGVFMKVMGEARIEGEKKGRYVQDANGNWKKK